MLLAAMLAACAGAPPAPDAPATDRGPFSALAPADAALHAEAVSHALDAPVVGVVYPWQGATPGIGGEIVVVAERVGADGRRCRDVRERLAAPAVIGPIVDTACRDGDRWVWSRADVAAPGVRGPVDDWPEKQVFVTTTQTTMGVVARAHGLSLDVVRRLNPGLSERLPPGTRVRLP